jgi:hypothetical protein
MVLSSAQGIGIKDQGHLAIAHDCGTGVDRLALEGIPECLDDHFLFADQSIDDYSPGLARRVDDQNDAFTWILYPILEAKLRA